MKSVWASKSLWLLCSSGNLLENPADDSKKTGSLLGKSKKNKNRTIVGRGEKERGSKKGGKEKGQQPRRVVVENVGQRTTGDSGLVRSVDISGLSSAGERERGRERKREWERRRIVVCLRVKKMRGEREKREREKERVIGEKCGIVHTSNQK